MVLPSRGRRVKYNLQNIVVSRELSLSFLVHLDVHKLHSSIPLSLADKWFAVAFIAHLFAVVGTGIVYGPTAFNDSSITDDTNNVDTDDYAYGGSASDKMSATHPSSLVVPKEFWIVVVAISLLVAPALSLVALSIMSR